MPKISYGAVFPLKSAVILSVASLSIPLLANTVGATYLYQQLTPMSRAGYNWVLYLGGGINPDGYFYAPPSAQQVWGVPLADGVYAAPAAWNDAEAVNITFEIHGGYVVRQDWDFSQARPQTSSFSWLWR